MRMRKKKNLDTRLAACAAVMADDPAAHRGAWRALFGNENPVHLEIGLRQGPLHYRDGEALPGDQFRGH